jgi:sigma-B regulation protein RsbU (phosphoserine phosphatase)
MADTQLKEVESHQLQCLEIWGGTTAVDEAVSVHGLDLYAFSRPFHDEVSGGDVYLVSMCGAGNIARIMLADVAGHGTAVSSLGRSLRGLMRKHITTADQTQLARELNEEFTRRAEEGRFATAVLATYFAPTDHLIVVNAGHPPPLWYHARQKTWELLEATRANAPEAADSIRVGATNLPLGIIEPTPYAQFVVPLEPRDLVVLYTDALIETRDADGELLGTRGLLELVRSLDASAFETLSTSIRNALTLLRGGQPPYDDLTILVLHHNAANPPRLSIGERLQVLGRMMGIGRLEAHL